MLESHRRRPLCPPGGGQRRALLQIFIDEILSLAACQPETFPHVTQSIPLIVRHLVPVEAEPREPSTWRNSSKVSDPWAQRTGSDRNRWKRDELASRASPARRSPPRSVPGADRGHRISGSNSPKLRSQPRQTLLRLHGEPAIDDRKRHSFPNLESALYHLASAAPRRELHASRGIEQFVRASARYCGASSRPARSICATGLLGWFLSGSFFCHQTSSCRQFSSICSAVGSVSRRETKPRVEVFRIVISPAIPPRGIVREVDSAAPQCGDSEK